MQNTQTAIIELAEDVAFLLNGADIDCPHCKWEGRDSQMRSEKHDDLDQPGGWYGYKYHCPECNRWIASWTMVTGDRNHDHKKAV